MMARLREGEYGWRCRLGLIVPSLNVVAEPEMRRLAPDGVSVHSARMYLAGATTPESYARMAEDAEAAADLLATAGMDAIAYACTSGSILEDSGRITEILTKAAGVPSVTTARAVADALRALGLRRIAVATPYVEFVNKEERRFLESAGFEISAIRGLGLGHTSEERLSIGRVGLDAVRALARQVDSEAKEADGIFISCTNLATIGALEELEKEFKKPVVSSNAATFWAALRCAGQEIPIEGHGTLLRTFPPLGR